MTKKNVLIALVAMVSQATFAAKVETWNCKDLSNNDPMPSFKIKVSSNGVEGKIVGNIHPALLTLSRMSPESSRSDFSKTKITKFNFRGFDGKTHIVAHTVGSDGEFEVFRVSLKRQSESEGRAWVRYSGSRFSCCAYPNDEQFASRFFSCRVK